MKTDISHVIQDFNEKVNWLALSPHFYAKEVRKDFTRSGKLPLQRIVPLLLSFSAQSLSHELLTFYHFDPEAASSSALIQKRKKIKPEASMSLS